MEASSRSMCEVFYGSLNNSRQPGVLLISFYANFRSDNTHDEAQMATSERMFMEFLRYTSDIQLINNNT